MEKTSPPLWATSHAPSSLPLAPANSLPFFTSSKSAVLTTYSHLPEKSKLCLSTSSFYFLAWYLPQFVIRYLVFVFCHWTVHHRGSELLLSLSWLSLRAHRKVPCSLHTFPCKDILCFNYEVVSNNHNVFIPFCFDEHLDLVSDRVLSKK